MDHGRWREQTWRIGLVTLAREGEETRGRMGEGMAHGLR